MNLAPFQQVQLGGAKRFEEFHFHFGIALGVLAHECRKHAFDHCGVAATFSTPLSPRRRSSARSPSAPTWPNRLRQSPSNCSPSPVRTSRRPTRSKSMRPSSCSRSLICRDKAGWRAALSPLRRQPRIGLDPVGAGSAEPGLRGGDGGRFGLTGLHVQPRLAVGDVSARQAQPHNHPASRFWDARASARATKLS